MSKTPEILHIAIRQYKHNTGDGLVMAFDADETIRVVNDLCGRVEHLTKELARAIEIARVVMNRWECGSIATYKPVKRELNRFRAELDAMKGVKE